MNIESAVFVFIVLGALAVIALVMMFAKPPKRPLVYTGVLLLSLFVIMSAYLAAFLSGQGETNETVFFALRLFLPFVIIGAFSSCSELIFANMAAVLFPGASESARSYLLLIPAYVISAFFYYTFYSQFSNGIGDIYFFSGLVTMAVAEFVYQNRSTAYKPDSKPARSIGK